MRHPRTLENQGFSLIQMAMLVAVASIILVSILPGAEKATEAGKQATTRQRMEAIEKATQAFMAQNLRRPCPASGTYATTNQYFGIEAANPGFCTGGTPAADFNDAQTVVGTYVTTAKTLTALTGLTGINLGSYITGPNMPTNGFVASIDTATQVTMDKYPTAANTRNVTFTTFAAGTVPVKTLGLPDEYALDGYGRRIMYVVDKRATRPYSTYTASPPTVSTPPVPTLSSAPNSCNALQSQGLKGAIRIFEDNNSPSDGVIETDVLDYTMWALISYGKAGHGAFPANGSTVANRINAGGSDADSVIPDANQINAFVDPTTDFTTQFLGNLILEPQDSSQYKTIVWYADDTKNTCCVGKMCSLGFDIRPASVGTGDDTLGTNVTTGDINGDGLTDLVFGVNQYGTTLPGGTGNRVYVIFGRKTGWPIPYSSTANVITDINTIATDGAYGFFVQTSQVYAVTNFGKHLATGDINRDGYDDIIIGGDRITFLFGEPNVSTNRSTVATFAGLNNSPAAGASNNYGMVIIYDTGGGAGQAVMTADLQTNGYKSAVFSGGLNSNYVWVIYDQLNAGAGGLTPIESKGTAVVLPRRWTLTDAVNAYNQLTATYGFRFTSSNTTNFPFTGSSFNYASGDVDGDGNDELIIGAHSADNTGSSNQGKVYVLFPPFTVTAAGPPAALDITAGGAAWSLTPTNMGVYFTESTGNSNFGRSVASADMNNDGYKDIIVSEDDHIYMYYGMSPADWSTAYTAGTPDGNIADAADVTINTSVASGRPGWITNTFPYVIKTGDVNNDGKMDLLLGTYDSATPSDCTTKSNAGSVYVLFQPPKGWETGPTNLFQAATAGCNSSEMNLGAFDSGVIDCDVITGKPELCGFRIDGSATDSNVYIPAVGDLNADGKNDIFVTGPKFNSNDGIGYCIWGRRNTTWDNVIDLNAITSQ